MFRRCLATIIAFAIVALPGKALADSIANDYAMVVPAAKVCQFLKYNVDADGLANAADHYFNNLSDTDPIEAINAKQSMASEFDEAQRDMAVFLEPDMQVFLAKLEPVFRRRNDQCSRIAGNPNFSAYIKSSEFSLSEKEQSALNWIAFYANENDAFTMGMMATLYFTGSGGYPKDRKAAYGWIEKAARGGDGFSMSMLCDAQIKGADVPKDRISAARWCYIARIVDPDTAKVVTRYERALTVKEKAAGKAAAHIWLVDNEYE